MPNISEKNFEVTIEAMLLAGGPNSSIQGEKAIRDAATVEGAYIPGGYQKRSPGDYNKVLCLLPQDVLDFIFITQSKEWDKLKKNAPGDTETHFLNRLASEIKKRGTLDVLRNGIKDVGCK